MDNVFDATLGAGEEGGAEAWLLALVHFLSVAQLAPSLLAVSLLVVQRESSYTVLLLSLASSWAQASCPHRPCLSAFGAQLPLCLSAAHTGFQSK